MIGQLEAIHFGSPRFRSKLESALSIAGRALTSCERPYIAFSGGKDSVALAGIVHALRPEVELAWSDDELEYPEAVAFMDQLRTIAGPQLTITLGWAEHAGWFRSWTQTPAWRDPLPGAVRIEMGSDDWQASRGYDLTFTGLRMAENRRRRDWLASVGPVYRVRAGTGRRCCPLWDWTADDVWALISGWGLAYCPVYDRLDEIGVPRNVQRLGPLPLARRAHLADGWPELLNALEVRYARQWSAD